MLLVRMAMLSIDNAFQYIIEYLYSVPSDLNGAGQSLMLYNVCGVWKKRRKGKGGGLGRVQ